MKDNQVYTIRQADELDQLAGILLKAYPCARIFAFYGPMGVGKTTFIKHLCRSLGVSDLVSSPSFPIVNHYVADEGDDIYHFDFYRIENHEEVYDLGYEDYFYSGNYCFIEWPEKIEHVMPDNAVPVYMNMKNEHRIIRF